MGKEKCGREVKFQFATQKRIYLIYWGWNTVCPANDNYDDFPFPI